MEGEFSEVDFASLARVLHAALPMPISKDVSPFLVPSANENVMSTLHELVLKCVGAVVSKGDVFDDEPGYREGKFLLVKKPHVIDVHRVLPVATDRPDDVILFRRQSQSYWSSLSWLRSPRRSLGRGGGHYRHACRSWSLITFRLVSELRPSPCSCTGPVWWVESVSLATSPNTF